MHRLLVYACSLNAPLRYLTYYLPVLELPRCTLGTRSSSPTRRAFLVQSLCKKACTLRTWYEQRVTVYLCHPSSPSWAQEPLRRSRTTHRTIPQWSSDPCDHPVSPDCT